MKNAGLYEQIGVPTSQKVMPPLYVPDIDPHIGVRNAQAIHDYSRRLADAVEAVVRAGQYGLCFIDGHADFLGPETSRTGGAAGMDLALVTGYGPTLLTAIEGRRPLANPDDTVLLANRDHPTSYGLTIDPGILNYDLDTLREIGMESAAANTLAHYSAGAAEFNLLPGFVGISLVPARQACPECA